MAPPPPLLEGIHSEAKEQERLNLKTEEVVVVEEEEEEEEEEEQEVVAVEVKGLTEVSSEAREEESE